MTLAQYGFQKHRSVQTNFKSYCCDLKRVRGYSTTRR